MLEGMKLKKALVILLTGLLIITLATGCGADSSQPGMDTDSAYRSESYSATEEAGQGMNSTEAADRRIVRNAQADLSAEDVITAYEQILDFINAAGGYEASRNQRQQDDRISIDAQLRLPPEKLDDFLDFLDDVGEVINKQISTEDITAQYFDAQTRLESMEKALERYYDYLQDSASIQETLSVQSEINHLTVEIESLKGKLSLWDTQLKESTVTLRLRQIDDPLLLKQEIDWSALSWDDMQYLMQAGLKTVLNVLIGFFQWLAIILVAASPLWIAALIVILIVRKKAKKRKKQSAAWRKQQSEQQAVSEQAVYVQSSASQQNHAPEVRKNTEPEPSANNHSEQTSHEKSGGESQNSPDKNRS